MNEWLVKKWSYNHKMSRVGNIHKLSGYSRGPDFNSLLLPRFSGAPRQQRERRQANARGDGSTITSPPEGRETLTRLKREENPHRVT